MFASDANVIVELIGGRDPAGTWVRRALESGRSVVTANKQLIAHEGAELRSLAATARRHLRFEAAVAGGIPVIGALRNGIGGDRLVRADRHPERHVQLHPDEHGEGGASFADALAARSSSGSPKPIRQTTSQGYDARAKLAILCASGCARR